MSVFVTYIAFQLTSRAVKDPSGRAMVLAVENIADKAAILCSPAHLADMYPVGSLLAMKEPYVCLGRSMSLPEIRVTVPTDIEDIPATPGVIWRFESPVSFRSVVLCDSADGSGIEPILHRRRVQAEGQRGGQDR
jgi:hypothetical protein